MFRRDFPVPLHHQAQEIASHLDGVQRLIQLVRNAGRHFPQGLHLAGLDELGILFNHFRNVGGRHHDGGLPFVGDVAGMKIHVKRFMPFLK